MTKTLYAIFDGQVFKPEVVIDLPPNQRYLIQVKLEQKVIRDQRKPVLQRISEKAMDLGLTDLAEQHDHYLYGSDKR